jgi:anti-sigma B factor antagonist
VEDREPLCIVAPPEIDPATVDELVAALEAAPADAVVEVDCSAVEFMDSSGVRALILASNRAEAAGGRVRVVRATNVVRRLLEITAVAHLLGDDGVSATG